MSTRYPRILIAFTVCLALACQLRVLQGQQDAPAEKPKIEKYEFTIDKQLDHTGVKSQDQTGTCWCFATCSFIESELMRKGLGQHELSEMFIVRNIYMDKAYNYVQRQGKANFSEGALAHDFINGATRYGLLPDEAYSGLKAGESMHNHSEMALVLESILKTLTTNRKPGNHWKALVSSVLDTYLGPAPANFSYRGKDYTPKSFAESLGFNGDDYVSYTSFSHHPFGRPFVLEIPDNFSNGSFENVPIDDIVRIIDQALDNGCTVAWDGDVSEKGFAQGNGLAVLPAPERRDGMRIPGDEMEVTQEMRQQTFEEHTTTDDHLMHLVGRAHDQLGTKYYIIKNSWGPTGPYGGYLYMSEAYVRLKTIAVLVHKDALAKTTAVEEEKNAPAESGTSGSSGN